MHRAINVALMLATLASTVALYMIKNDTRRLEARVHAQERALERARNDVTVLVAERAHLARPERLEPLARALGLAPVTAGQYLRLDPDRASRCFPSPVVEEGHGGGYCRTSAAGAPPGPSPPPAGDAPSAGWGGEERPPSRR